MKKKLIILGLLLASLFGPGVLKQATRDSSLPSYVVQLLGVEQGSCSGFHINIDGKVYILSASHCLVLADKGTILVQDDNTEEPIPLKILKEDPLSDTILLEPLPGRSGLSLAKNVYYGETLYTYTHGLGYLTYKTEGVYVQDEVIEVPLFPVTENDVCDTSIPKLKEGIMDMFIFQMKVCFLVENTMVTTAFIVPGSSGGVVTNKYGEVVGLVSAGGQGFGYLVTLSALKSFVNSLEK
jgi:hypothetical protein